MSLFVIAYISCSKYIVSQRLPHGAVIRVFPAGGMNNHKVIVLCPGGAYKSLARWQEGYMWVPFFHKLGYTIAVLEYRMPNHDYNSPRIDGEEAIAYLRNQSDKWFYAKNKIGIMGFSAGGHLASTMLVSENDSLRPDFGILLYPVVSMSKELCHLVTHDMLMGADSSENIEKQLSNELHITNKTPPVFIAVSSNDQIVTPLNSMCFYEEMKRKQRSAIIKIYPTGGHGWGYRTSFPYHDELLGDLSKWLEKF